MEVATLMNAGIWGDGSGLIRRGCSSDSVHSVSSDLPAVWAPLLGPEIAVRRELAAPALIEAAGRTAELVAQHSSSRAAALSSFPRSMVRRTWHLGSPEALSPHRCAAELTIQGFRISGFRAATSMTKDTLDQVLRFCCAALNDPECASMFGVSSGSRAAGRTHEQPVRHKQG